MRRQDAWPQESGFPPEHCFVVEDASSGLLLTRAGEMAMLRVARLSPTLWCPRSTTWR